MNFLYVNAFESYRLTDTQTESTEISQAASRVVRNEKQTKKTATVSVTSSEI